MSIVIAEPTIPTETKPDDVDLDMWTEMVTVKSTLDMCEVPVAKIAPAIGAGHSTYITVLIPLLHIKLHKLARKLAFCFCEDFELISILRASDGYLVTICTKSL